MSHPSEKMDSILCCRISVNLKQQIMDFRAKYRLPSLTSAIVQLIRIGLFIDSKREDLKNPDVVQFLQNHLYDSLLIDWLYSLDQGRLDALHGAINSAKALKTRSRLSGWK